MIVNNYYQKNRSAFILNSYSILFIIFTVLSPYILKYEISHAASLEALSACRRNNMISQDVIIKSCSELILDKDLAGRGSFWPYIYRGIAYRHIRDFDKSIYDFNSAIALIKDSPHGYIERGKLLFNYGMCGRAVYDFDEAIKLEQRNSAAHLWKALCLSNMDLELDAINEYNLSIDIDKYSFSSYLNLGRSYYKLKKYNESLKAYALAISLGKHPSSKELAMAYYGIGIANAALSDHVKAVDAYTKSIKIHKELHEAYKNRAASYAILGQDDLSAEDIRKYNYYIK